ncbi:HTH domain-containing protein [uncultured Desulfobacter sp.]|jgi:ATP-dependent DNA helicase RecG|uniref:HTH domain-containing protein n=1 Tax=uncultured Desulfobacter sp. TaxID=240139 RepID=UPI0029C82646|nr:HTH domain-containing protein [uncultured Desulfobacter sp.]
MVELLSRNNRITIKELAGELGVSDRTVKKHIKVLKDNGRLVRVGPDRGGYWKIIDSGPDQAKE